MTINNFKFLSKKTKKLYQAIHRSADGSIHYYRRRRGTKKEKTELERFLRGEDLGGKRLSSYTLKFLRQMHYFCEKCGRVGKTEGHHIKPLEYGGTTQINNIIFLCPNCHQEAHIEIERKRLLYKMVA